MKELHELKVKLMEELKDQARDLSKKGRMGAGDLDTISKLTKSIDRLCEIIESDDSGYSQAGTWRADMEGEYGRGASYRRDSRGRYARDSYARDGYSSTGYSRSSMVDHLEEMMGEASTEREREALRKCMETMRHM